MMDTQGRALYNLLRMRFEEDDTMDVMPWQVDNYREYETGTLFDRLKELGIVLDEVSYAIYADACNSPEELADTLWTDENTENYDKAYLLIFELWRRLTPEKQSLSIFCDELDYLIDLYDRDLLIDHDRIHDYLNELESLLDENVDAGADPKEIFQVFTQYCAHDLESFIYDFAADEMDHGHELYASELIDGFSPYIVEKTWFDFLNMRQIAQTAPEEVENMLFRLLEDQKENPDFELLLEIARFLVNRGAVSDFLETMKIALPLVQTEQDLQEILAITSEFCRLLDRVEEVEKIAQILKVRTEMPLEQEISTNDEGYKACLNFFENFNRSEA